jgi:hypothetical protein
MTNIQFTCQKLELSEWSPRFNLGRFNLGLLSYAWASEGTNLFKPLFDITDKTNFLIRNGDYLTPVSRSILHPRHIQSSSPLRTRKWAAVCAVHVGSQVSIVLHFPVVS